MTNLAPTLGWRCDWSAVTRVEEDAIFTKKSWRILPILLLAYLLAFIARLYPVAVKQELGFSDGVYGLGAGLFFITYLMFEVPSN
jgi:hypothetical protein